MNIGDPIFIGGMQKSGTSLLRAMLGHHSRLFAGLETQWLNQRWNENDTLRREWLQRLSVFFDINIGELETVCADAGSEEICLDRMMALFTARAGKVRWIEKTPGNVSAIPRILSHWPRACILHILRDPRDVYASMLEIRKWTDPEAFADGWCTTVGAAEDWLTSVGGWHPSYYRLRYERLVLEPDATLRDILDFLEEPYEPNVATFDGVTGEFERVKQATGKESPTLKRLEQPLIRSRVGVWKSVYEPERWSAVRAELNRRGYGVLVEALLAETDRCLDRNRMIQGARCP